MDMLKDRVRPLYLKLFAASFGSALITCIFALIDAVMVGKYHGPDGTAALSIVNPIWSLMYGLGLLIGIGASVLYSVFRGAGEKQKANEYFTLSILTAVAVSITVTVLVTIFQ